METGADPGAIAVAMLHATPDCIKLVELDGRLSFVNLNGRCAAIIDMVAVARNLRWQDIWPEKSRNTIARAIADAGRGLTVSFEAFCPDAAGKPRWWSVLVAPVRGADGQVLRLVASSRDITDRVMREREIAAADAQLKLELEEKQSLIRTQQLLMGEIDHRVRNSLSLIASILRLQMRRLPDGPAHEAFEDSVARIESVASVHETLYRSGRFDRVNIVDYVEKIVDRMARSLTEKGGIAFSAEPEARRQIGPDAAVAIGVIVTELLGNAVRHGGGSAIETLLAMTEGERLTLSVSDSGPGLPDTADLEAGSSLGMTICRIYAEKLDATLTSGTSPTGGAIFTLSLPAAAVSATPAG